MKCYKVWAVKPWGEQGEALIRAGYLHDNDKGRILLLRTGSMDSSCAHPPGPYEFVEPFDGRPMQALALAYERTGYTGVVVIKDFDLDEWHTGSIGSLGTFLLVAGNCPEMFREGIPA